MQLPAGLLIELPSGERCGSVRSERAARLLAEELPEGFQSFWANRKAQPADPFVAKPEPETSGD